MAKETHYEALQVHVNADPEVIEAAYKRLAAKYHPDRNPAADATRRMQQLNDAFRVLKDLRLRAAYDERLRRDAEEERLRLEQELRSQRERDRRQWEREARNKTESPNQAHRQPPPGHDAPAQPPPHSKPQARPPVAFALGQFVRRLFRKRAAWLSVVVMGICALYFAWRSWTAGLQPSRATAGPTATPSAIAQSNETRISAMSRIPGGLFMMGSTDGIGLANEHPSHQVAVAPFELEATEVTVEAYTACVHKGICSPAGTGNVQCNYGRGDRSDHPINCVDWTQAVRYCTAQGKRLPSEEEWEFAARGGTEGGTFPWGNSEPNSQLCWSGISKREGTCTVGSFERNPYGLADMAGNVWEWTASGDSPNYNATRVDDARIIRGGSWAAANSSNLRNAYRAWGVPTDSDSYLGFRCAR